jgi:glycerol kinase
LLLFKINVLSKKYCNFSILPYILDDERIMSIKFFSHHKEKSMKYILAIDQGTSGNRAILYNKKGEIIASAYKEFTQYFPAPGWVEHDPVEIIKDVRGLIRKVIQKAGSESIAAIGITNQRETTVLWDKKTGKPIYNAIVWQCRRTASRCEILRKTKGAQELIRKKTGLPIDAYFSATKIEWLLKNIPGAMKKAQNGELLFGTTDTWLLWNLTGGKIHATDYTNASRTMLFNIERLEWDKDLLKIFNIPEKILPEVKKSSGIFGYTAREKNNYKNIPISGIAGDQQSALFGQICFKPGEIKNTYGTGSFILMNTGRKRPVSKHGLITTICCDSDGRHAYALEGSAFIAGAAIQWLRDQLEIIQSASMTEEMAVSVKDNGGVYFVPALTGLGAPYWNQEARGIISGLTRGTTRNHIVRAALEAMCYQTKDIIEAMQKDSGLKIRDIRIDGGAVKNNFLCQFQADLLGINVIRPKITETTSLGAAYLAGLAVGYWKNSDDIENNWSAEKKFKPRMNSIEVKKLYSGWKYAINRALL